MVDRLTKDIEAHGTHLTTGFLGTPFLMFVLDQNHRMRTSKYTVDRDGCGRIGYFALLAA